MVLAKLKEHPKVKAVVLFGSWARNEITPLSDIDLAVILDDPTPEDEAEVGSLYTPKVDVVLFHRLPLPVQFAVIREGRELFVRDEEFHHRVRLRTVHRYLEMAHLYQALVREVLG
ncbi:MAG: type VII toxin-antitoxin system MntA family adenylyltransferase antitoxin [Candidatus Bipolaricaulaceae bacterium]